MSYIDKLYEDLQDKKALYEFLRQVIGPCPEGRTRKAGFYQHYIGKSYELIFEVQDFIRSEICVSDYEVEYYVINGHVYSHDAQLKLQTENYLRYMASHYEGYAEDCLNYRSEKLEKEKQKKLEWLEGVFASTHTDNV